MLEGTDSPEQRRAARRARRWRRRARIAAPFLAVPVMLGLLILSVDLIEYHPTGRTDRTDVPTRPAASAPRATRVETMALAPESLLSVSVVDSVHREASQPFEASQPQATIPRWPSESSSLTTTP